MQINQFRVSVPLQVTLYLTIVTCWTVPPGQSQTSPITPATDGTGTHLIQQGNRFDITGGKASGDGTNLFHSFQQFGLSEGQIANFISNPAIKNILGRVSGGDPSLINGLIQVTGGHSNLFLINPAGIVFGPSASLNVPASFTATTANGIGFGDRWFNAFGPNDYQGLVGSPSAFAFTTPYPGGIVNFGNLSVPVGENLTLLGGSVLNIGQLAASSGQIMVAAISGERLVRVSQPGHLLNLEIQTLSTSLPTTNLQVSPASIPQLLTGIGVNHASNIVVHADGSLQLTPDGVRIPTDPGVAIASGRFDTAGLMGGTIQILGNQVGLLGANLDATGIQGGGTIRIGGEYRGLGLVPNALNTFVSQDSHLHADALATGNGGRVIVWADETTRFYGTITARGGSQGGNGGFVETSGKTTLDMVGGTVDASASFGQPGIWLLDPSDITISANATSGGTLSAPTAFSPTGATSNVANTDIESALNNGTSVTLTTEGGSGGNGDITVSAPISKTAGTDASLTLQADRNIAVNANITSSSNRLNVTLNSNRGGVEGAIAVNNAAIATNGGDLILGGGNTPASSPAIGTATNPIGVSIVSSSLNAGSGNITLTGTGTTAAGILLQDSSINSTTTTGNGTITLTADEINLLGNTTIQGTGILQLQPLTPSLGIVVGGTTDDTQFNIGSTELATLQNGFTQIEIGRLDSSGPITLSGNVTFSDPIILRSPTGNGTIDTTGGTLSGTDNANITLLANQTITLNSITNPAGSISITSSAGSINGNTATLDTSSTTGNGNPISLSAATDVAIGNLNTSTTATSATAQSGTISLTASSGNLTIGNSLNASATTGLGSDMTLKGNVILPSGNTTLTTVGGAGSGNITFTQSISATTTDRNLTLEAGAGGITVSGAIGSTTLPLGIITANSTGTTILNAVDAVQLSLNGGGTAQLQGNITTTAAQSYEDAVVIANSPTLTGNGITFNSTISGTGNLTINANSANITFSGAISSLGNLTANSTGTTIFNTVNAASLTTDAEGTTQLQGNVTTTGSQTYGDPVTISNNPTLTGNGITFESTLDGNSSLTITDTSGGVFFNGVVGSLIELGDLTINSGSEIATDDVNATSIDFTAIGGIASTGNLSTSSESGDGGPITLSVTNGDIEVVAIDTQGSDSGSGGIVDISTDGFFRASGTFTDRNGISASISTAGGLAGGNITIEHGGATTTPFIIGDATTNGTAGAITSGASNTIAPTLSVPVPPDTYTDGNIKIITTASTSTPTPSPTPEASPSPTPEASPSPTPEANPSPTPEANPSPTPEANPSPTPEANPSPILGSGSEPTPSPSLEPQQQPGTPTPQQQPGTPTPQQQPGTPTPQQQPGTPTPQQQPGTPTPQQPPGGQNPQQPPGGQNPQQPPGGQNPQQPPGGQNPQQPPGGQNPQQPPGGQNPQQPPGGQNPQQPPGGQNPQQPGGQNPQQPGGQNPQQPPGGQNPQQPGGQNPQQPPGGQNPQQPPGGQNPQQQPGRPNPQQPPPGGQNPQQQPGRPNPQQPPPGGPNPQLPPRDANPQPRPENRPPANSGNTEGIVNVDTNGGNNPGSLSSSNAHNQQILRVENNNVALTTPEPATPNINTPTDNSVANPPIPSNLQGTLSIAQNSVSLTQNLDVGNIETAIPQIEQVIEQQYSNTIGEATVAPTSVKNIRENLSKVEQQTGKKSGIVYVILRPDRLDLLLVTSDTTAIHRTVWEANRKAILQKAQEFRADVTNATQRFQTRYLPLAQELYQWLIAPLEAELQTRKIETLLFSMDSGLRSLPIAALHDGKQFLIEKYSLSLIPSISLTDTRYEPLSEIQILAMGASTFKDKNPLPAVPIELQAITANERGVSFLNEAFTLENLKSQRQKNPYQIIHLATHGEFLPGSASNSYIQLWDTRLQLNQIRQLGWKNPPVELLVLSACRTALGDEQAELGFAGFAVQAGVKSVLASLWYVSDAGTLGLMTEFYNRLRQGTLKAEALREAQIAMIRGEVKIEAGALRGARGGGIELPPALANVGDIKLSHPYYWSGFTMIGNPW